HPAKPSPGLWPEPWLRFRGPGLLPLRVGSGQGRGAKRDLSSQRVSLWLGDSKPGRAGCGPQISGFVGINAACSVRPGGREPGPARPRPGAPRWVLSRSQGLDGGASGMTL
ncbi:Hypothetical predicted protein, partial [Marmota monax]